MAPKRLFIAATRQNDGKTMVSLGLFNAIQSLFSSSGYMKPVGQQYQIINGSKIDKDAVLFRTIYGLKDEHPLMSPVAIPNGFTEKFIFSGNTTELENNIVSAFNTLSATKDFMLMEGTGHAGVGSVLGLSNARVAQLLDSKVILVTLGGIGRAIDEIMMNKACFDQLGVEVAGVIINKVREDKYDKVDMSLRKYLSKMGIKIYGLIPYSEQLTKPSIFRLKEALEAQVLTGIDHLNNHVQKIMIGDMIPHHALDEFDINTLLIVPSDREGLIMTAICGDVLNEDSSFNISGIIFTGGRSPKTQILDMLKRSHIPSLLVNDDSFSVATKINRMLVKLDSNEFKKIKTVQSLVQEYVNIDAILKDIH